MAKKQFFFVVNFISIYPFLFYNSQYQFQHMKMNSKQPINLFCPKLSKIKPLGQFELHQKEEQEKFDVVAYLQEQKIRRLERQKQKSKYDKKGKKNYADIMKYIEKEEEQMFIVKTEQEKKEERKVQQQKEREIERRKKEEQDKKKKGEGQKEKQERKENHIISTDDKSNMKVELQKDKNEQKKGEKSERKESKGEKEKMEKKKQSEQKQSDKKLFNYNLFDKQKAKEQKVKENSTSSILTPVEKKQKPIEKLFPIQQKKQTVLTPNLFSNIQSITSNQDKERVEKQKSSKEKIKDEPQLSKKEDVLSSHSFLNKLIQYSGTMRERTQIQTRINNLNGALSNINDVFLFSKSFLGTINKNKQDQISTFAYKIWNFIVHNFIRKTNVKDGYERIPPKQNNAQIEKNSINKYILVVNIWRCIGAQKVWNLIFGQTLKMLQFIYTQKSPPSTYKDLQLFSKDYIPLHKDISLSYLTKLDYLTYFLFGLTLFDPLEVLDDITSGSNENFSCLQELRKANYKWSYKEFWNLFSVIKENNYQAHHKPVVYMNIISTTYPQILQNKKTGSFKQFFSLQNWIIEEGNKLCKKINQSEDFKILSKEDIDEGSFQFDGQGLCNAIQTVSRRFAGKKKQLKMSSKEFQEKCSVFYYFWKKE